MPSDIAQAEMHDFWTIPELVQMVLQELHLKDIAQVSVVSRTLRDASIPRICEGLGPQVDTPPAPMLINFFPSELRELARGEVSNESKVSP